MARRTELKGIVKGLVGGFIGRKNEFCGYWAIGHLKLLATGHDIDFMTFSYPVPQPCGNSEIINTVRKNFSSLATRLLKQQGIPELWIKNITLTLNFNVSGDGELAAGFPARGELFKCVCEITDDYHRVYSSSAYGRCYPHSPALEQQSLR